MGKISDFLKAWLGRRDEPEPAKEEPGPSDILPVSAIKIVGSQVRIDTSQCLIPWTIPPFVHSSKILGTKSMLPVFNKLSNNILLEPADRYNQIIMVDFLYNECLKGFGNIAVYDRGVNDFIIHRIVKVGRNQYGRYFTFKGDNNDVVDNLIVRGYHIKYVVCVVVY